MSKPKQLPKALGFPVLHFLWQWKLATTNMIAQRFFPHFQLPTSTYTWLWRLKQAKFITQAWNREGTHFHWTLDRAGYAIVKESLPTLREDGYRSEYPSHDWIVTAFHLGGWLTESPPGVEAFSEQQLRRLDPTEFPAWVPQNLSHRPDGYWHRCHQGRDYVLALEVELTRKRKEQYQSVGTFYGDTALIGRVLWVVRSLADARAISEALQKAPGARPRSPHNFVKLDSFRRHGWSAQIEHGPGKGIAASDYIAMALGFSKETILKECRIQHFNLFSLEAPKRGVSSAPSGHRNKGSVFVQTATHIAVPLPPNETRTHDQPEVSL